MKNMHYIYTIEKAVLNTIRGFNIYVTGSPREDSIDGQVVVGYERDAIHQYLIVKDGNNVKTKHIINDNYIYHFKGLVESTY